MAPVCWDRTLVFFLLGYIHCTADFVVGGGDSQRRIVPMITCVISAVVQKMASYSTGQCTAGRQAPGRQASVGGERIRKSV